MNLYDINYKILQAYEKAVDVETGEILDASLMDEIDSLEMARDEKIKNIALWIKNLKSDVAELENEVDNLQQFKERKKKRILSLESYLRENLQGQKFDGGNVQISWRKSQSVVVENADALPDEFKRVKTIVEPDKNLLKDALKNGEVIDGAILMDNLSMQVR